MTKKGIVSCVFFLFFKYKYIFSYILFDLIWKKVDEKGLPHKENLLKVVVDNMPKVVHDDLVKRMETCLAEESEFFY